MSRPSSEPALPDPAPITEAPTTATAPGRRRLWQLPTQAHEILLGLSFTPEALRREAARVLGRLHRSACILQGREVDVLYGVVHDMGTRNPLSEAFQKRLEERHTLLARRMAALRSTEDLRAAWADALDGEAMPAALWALLTHPLGAELETDALYDARYWVFAHSRRSLGLALAQQREDALTDQARQQVEDLRARLNAQHQRAAEALSQARAEIARLTGELARAQLSVGTPVPDPPAPRRVEHRPEPAAKASVGAVARPALPPAAPPRQTMLADPPGPASPPISLHGRRVLCVGGRQRAVARYRGRIERLGGHFEHHDGGLEDGVQVLDGRLGRADLVICQAACINHEAYHRVKRHCERTGTPCVYLDRPSLSRLDRALAQAPAEDHALR